MTNILFKPLHPRAKMPVYGSIGAAGADLFAVVDENNGILTIPPYSRALVKTGVSIELRPPMWAEIRGRSGLAFKHGIAVLGGVIDNDYRGEIGVLLHNTESTPFQVQDGDRIAQLIISTCIQARFIEVNQLNGSDRGENGFGSTGMKDVA